MDFDSSHLKTTLSERKMSMKDILTVNALDSFLAASLSDSLRQTLNFRQYKKIEKRISEKYAISVQESIKDFQKLDAILRETFGIKADKIERDFISKIIWIEKINSIPWLVTDDLKICGIILESFGDPYKRTILDNIHEKEEVPLSMQNGTKVPQASRYRRINELVNKGLIVETGFSSSGEGRRAGKYTSILDKLKIDIVGTTALIKMRIKDEFIKTSFIYGLLAPQNRQKIKSKS